MSDSDTTPTRRDVLSYTGAATAAGLVGVPTVSAGSAADDTLPEGTRVFLGPDVGIDVPGEAATTGLGAADLAVVDPGTTVARGTLLGALRQGTPVAFAGTGSFDGLLSTLYGLPNADVERAVRDGRVDGGIGLPYSFGFEYAFDTDAAVSLAVPEGDVLNTVRALGGPTTGDAVFGYLGSRLTDGDDTSDVTLQSTFPNCPPNLDDPGEWNCLGYDAVDPDSTTEYCPYGPYQRVQWGVKLTNGDDDPNDYFGFETRMRITAGEANAVDCSSDQWETNQMDRSQTFNDGVVEEFGPETEQQDYSQSESVGFEISVSGKQIGAAASVAWSNTESRSGVKTRGDLGGQEKQVDYEFDIKADGNVGGSTLTTWLGQRIRVDDGTSSTDYAFDDRFEWVDRCGFLCSNSYHEETSYGTAYWYA